MHTTGLIITIFGCVLLSGSLMALACIKSDEDISAAEVFDFFVLGGVIGFFRNLFRAVLEGLRSRSSPAFPPLILFCVSFVLLALGAVLLMESSS